MSEEIEVCFITSTSNINTASYRIWVKDLAVYLNEIGTKAYVNKLPNNIKPNIVIILGKSDIDKCNNYKKKYPNNLIGIINPPGGILYKADFIITGSIEEKDSLAMNKNIFIFPLIENQYRKINQKIHNDKSEIIVGIHGSYTHLSKIDPHLKRALEEFSQSIKISLKIISNPMPKKWIYGKPKIKNLIVSDYNFKTFSDDILKCDIGLVPNITDNSPLFKKTSETKGLYNNDYFFRLKNKSNSGRVFTFIQHGIPVIADLTPSHLHILGNPENGFAVFNKDGWLNALKELSNSKIRNIISKNALTEFNRLYDPLKWAKKLIKNILEIR